MFNYEPRERDILKHPVVGVGARLHPPLNLLYGIKDVPSEAGRLRAEPISFRRPRRAKLTPVLCRFLHSPSPPLLRRPPSDRVPDDDGNGIGLRKGCRIELIKTAARPPVAGFVGILLDAFYDRRVVSHRSIN